MSKHQVRGGDVAGLLARFSQLQAKCKARTGQSYRLIVIHEAGLDGFWIHRTLQYAGIESHVVDPASIATSRRRRRVKTDGIDGEALVRALLAYKRGEPRVCAMAKAPTPEEEDRRQISREPSRRRSRSLTAERVEHQPHQGAALRTGRRGLPAGSAGSAPTAGGPQNWRWTISPDLPEAAAQPRARPTGTPSRTDQDGGGAARCASRVTGRDPAVAAGGPADVEGHWSRVHHGPLV